MSATVVYSNAIKLKTELHHFISTLDSGQGSPALQSKVRAGLNNLQRSIDDLEMLSRREVTSVKREITSGRASTLRDEHCQIQSAFDRYCSIESARIASEQRQELLGLDNSLQQRNSGANHFNHPEEQSTILMMDGLINERNVLEGAEQSIEQYLTMGRNALHELYEQRSMLKSTQKRLLDVANSLGLSSSVIRFIEQRTAADQWILYGGLAGTCLILWAIVHYFG